MLEETRNGTSPRALRGAEDIRPTKAKVFALWSLIEIKAAAHVGLQLRRLEV